jgi:hypothetical protein
MMLFLVIAAVFVVAGSFYADFKWRRWMAERKRDRSQ